VLIAGAGPVGMVAAASLVRHGVPVTVLEANASLSEESRASTFPPPTLDMLDALGAAETADRAGLIAPQFQYRARDGVIAQFDFKANRGRDRASVPAAVRAVRLTRILLERCAATEISRSSFSSPVHASRRPPTASRSRCCATAGSETETARFLIGADGARSETRNALAIDSKASPGRSDSWW
jgi:3-(3-hydroxy-phenyl)propionate hydroxylase